MPNIVDIVAGATPWAGSLVPATITYQSVRTNLGFDVPEALIIGLVVEGLGFVTVTTAIDLWEQRQEELVDGQARPVASFWIAVGGVVVYILVVELVNAVLGDGDIGQKVTMGLLSTFGLLGGLMVALRNQLGKRRAALADARDQEATERAKAVELQAEIEREEREHEWKIKEEKLRLAHELKVKKLELSSHENVPVTFQKVAKGSEMFPETFGKWSDWRKVPESVRKDISKLQSPEEVSEMYGVSIKTGKNWWNKAKMEVNDVAETR